MHYANSFFQFLEDTRICNNKILNYEELENKLGTSFYKIAVFTEGGVLINPAKLVRAMIDVLPKNIELYENSPLIKWNKNNNLINCQFEKNLIQTNTYHLVTIQLNEYTTITTSTLITFFLKI